MLRRKILISIITFFSGLMMMQSQDLSVINTTSPVSACSLTATENVTIRIFNYGATLVAGSSFNVSYTINGGAAVTELLTLGSNLNMNSTLNYTFISQANLLAAGTYTVDATVSIAGDINPTNDAFSGYLVTNTAPSVGGTVSGGTNVCVSGNTGNLTLAGHTGTVQNWEYSIDGGSTWISISNTTTTQSYLNLTVPTSYRAVVQNGSCATSTSSNSSFTIDPVTVGGTVGASATICSGSSGNLTLSGKTGSVLNWEFSTNGGATWTTIANTTTAQAYTALITTTRYRANVQSGACSALTSSTATITVNPVTVGGSINPAATTVCSGSNSGTLTLSGHTGTISRWEFSTNGGTTWTNVANTTTTLSYTNLVTTTMYRALVKSGVCAAIYSSTSTITVSASSTGGTVTASATVCSGANAGTLTLSGHAGSILGWQYSTDGGTTYNAIANTTTTESYTNIVTNTLYRAVVQNGTCASANSAVATITVNAASVGGTLSANDTVCASSNSGSITLAGKTGNVQNWEYSTNSGVTWTNIANITTTNAFSNLVDTTLYRASVKNGVCAAVYSDTVEVVVDPITVAGSVSGTSVVCSGLNTDTLRLSGQTGTVLNWEYSTDGGSTWVNVVNDTTIQVYNNITSNTLYHSLVKSGVCAAAYSSSASLTVNAQAFGGTTYGATTVCEGANTGTVTLVGYSSNVADWESSIDGGLTWSSLANVTSSYSYTNLLQSTIFRAIASSGVCPNDTSTTTIIAVDIPSVGGVVSTSDTVCAGNNAGTLNLAGHTGNILNWEYSVDNGTSWILLSNTTTTQNYSNLSVSTYYRANIKNGVCASDLADSVYIKVDSIANAGIISSAAQLCVSNANGTLTLGGYTGSIVDWQSSSDNGATWLGLANATNSTIYAALIDTTYYRAIVSSGVCGNDTTSNVVIAVDALSDAGVISSSDTVCASGNGATLTLGAITGTIQGWEYSSDNGNSWISLANATANQTYTNLTSTRLYRAYVKNGVCPVAVADTAIITVDPVVDAGIISSSAQLCVSNANGTLTLGGYIGSIVDWQSSSDNGATWLGLANTTNSNAYAALIDTTYYRAVVSSGVCGNDTTSNVIIRVDALSDAGAISSSDTVCASGNGATLTLGAITGTIQGWEYSADNGNSWISLANTTASQMYSNLSSTHLYRAYVKNGVCPVAVADTAIITVDPIVDAGIISSAAHLCISNASGTLTLGGYTGSIVDWQYMDTLTVGWHPLSNTTNSNAYTSLTDTTYYRAIVSSGVCGNDTTSTITIGVDQLSVGGSTGINDTVCASLNGDTLAITAYTGNIVNWEYSTNNGNSWVALTNNNDSLVYSGLSTSTVYHAIVKNGVCPPVYSSNVTIKVDAVTNPGFITGGSTACQSNNTGILNLNNSVGTVLDWIYSNDNGATWLSTTTDTVINYTYNNLGDTTWFKVIVKNGVCSTDTSNAQTVYVYPSPVVTLTLDTVCLRDTTHILGAVSIPSGIIQQFKLNFGDGTILTNSIQNHVYAVADTFNVSLLAYSTFGCTDTAFATAVVKRIPSAVILHSSPLSFCPGDSTLLNFSLDSNAVYTWSTLATDTFTVVDSTQTVILTVTDTLNGCPAIDSVHVVKFQLDSISAGLDTTVALGSSIQLQGYGTGTINWTPAALLDFPLILNPMATPAQDTMFVIQITDANNCEQRDTVSIKVNLNYVFDVKDVLTPNGDGMNDVWTIKNIDSYKDNEVTVFNRDGNIVYHKKEYTNDWGGTFNGNQLPDGAYFYVIKFEKNEKVLKGSINILTNK